MATDIRDEAALRAMAALIECDFTDEWVIDEICDEAFDYADAFLRARARFAAKIEAQLRAKLNHD